MKPRLLDLFCGAGGCAKGYQRAGFEVWGVDNKRQPNYPFPSFAILADAIGLMRDLLDGAPLPREVSNGGGHAKWVGVPLTLGDFAAIRASPPCQAHTKAQKLMGNDHPDLIGATRELLVESGLPYVIENVKGAPLLDPQILEGQMFGLNTHRPRLFETNWEFTPPFLRCSPPRQAKMGRKPKLGEAIQVVGHYTDHAAAQEAMGIDWMTRDELAQAIPPAYTELVGGYLMAHLIHTEVVPV